jgi:lysosomal acid lipase/cholesteryl ester hydrolase
MGTHDVPAFIDKIKSVTGKSQVSYMGHSEGSTQFLAGASLKPDYFKANID